MRLLFLSITYPAPWQPTGGTFNRALVRELRREHEVRVVVPRPWTTLMRAGASDTSLAAEQAIGPLFLYPPGFWRHHHGAFMWQSIKGPVRRLVADFPPDAVITYFAHPDGEAGLRLARERGVPCLVTVGGSDLLVLAREPRRREAVRRVLVGADAVLAVGAHLRERVIELGVSPAKVHLFRRGVDNELFHPGSRTDARRRLGLPEDEPVLLWAGRMVPVKGLDVLLETASQVQAAGRRFRLCLVGGGPLEARLREQTQRAGLGERVRFVGPVPQEQLPDWYRAADLTLLPSLSEGMPNVLLESLACGTPFLASDVGSIRELTVRPDRDLVPPGNREALAQALTRRLDSGPATAGANGLTFTWTPAIELIGGLVKRLVAERSGTARP